MWPCSCISRLLNTQSLEWFYNNVRRRFKRFGSAKVLKNLYRRHAAEHGSLAEITGTRHLDYCMTFLENSHYDSFECILLYVLEVKELVCRSC